MSAQDGIYVEFRDVYFWFQSDRGLGSNALAPAAAQIFDIGDEILVGGKGAREVEVEQTTKSMAHDAREEYEGGGALEHHFHHPELLVEGQIGKVDV